MSNIVIIGDANISLTSPKYFGNKVLGLYMIEQAGLPIPFSIVLPAKAPFTPECLQALKENFTFSKRLIVRSSSTLEDGEYLSYAGAFKSIFVDKVEAIEEAVWKIRQHANSVYQQEDIAIIIQDVISGSGGVYLLDITSKQEQLEISMLGASRITDGSATNEELLLPSSAEYKISLTECQKLAHALGKSCDIEFALIGDKLVFLQYRKLSGLIPIQEQNELAEYFPRPLEELCGSLWGKVLTSCLKQEIIFSKGRLCLKSNPQENKTPYQQFSFVDFQNAFDFYTQTLFPKWQYIATKISHPDGVSPISRWHFAHELWEEFYIDYFSNPYEHIVSYARKNTEIGGACTPLVVEWLQDIKNLSQQLSQIGAFDDFLSTSEVMAFLNKYGHRFVDPHYFNEPSLIEQPKLLLRLLSNFENIFFNVDANPSIKTRTAWLAFDDNEYKHYINSALRKIICSLIDELIANGSHISRENVWSLDLEQFESLLLGNNIQQKSVEKGDLENITIKPNTSYSASILSTGSINGFIQREPSKVTENSIFVAWNIESFDYPTLIRAAGVIVAYGAKNSHYAIFARDFKKPMYCSVNAVNELPDGTFVSLLQPTMEIRVNDVND